MQLNVHGELDLSTSPELSEALEREILAGRSVVVDLSAVTFIDSTGLNALIRGMRACKANGGSFAVNPNLPDQVRRVFEITGLGSVLPISAR